MPTPLRPAVDLLTDYARYHRDQRNIQTHMIGVPMIVFAIGVLLSHPLLRLGHVTLTPAWALFAPIALWYLSRGHLRLGLATSLSMAALLALAQVLAHHQEAWLAWGVALFAIGWVFQFVGHYYEGRKPAFTDDAIGLLVGPMFVLLELLATLAPFRALAMSIESRAGPTHLRDLTRSGSAA